MSLSLKSSGEVLLDGSESLGSFVIDRVGAVGLDHEVVRKVISRIVRALNSEHEQVLQLQNDVDELHGTTFSLKEHSTSVDKLLQQMGDDLAQVKIDAGNLKARLERVEKHTQKDKDQSSLEAQVDKLKEEVTHIQDYARDTSAKLQVTDNNQREDSKKFAGQLTQLEETLGRHTEFLDEELDQHLRDIDDSLLSLKLDLESVQGSLTETNKTKASKEELAEMQKTLKGVLQEVETDHATLQEAAANLGKLENCTTLAMENKSRSEEIWRVFRQENQEMRSWASKSLGEVWEQLRQKMDRSVGVSQLQELQDSLRTKTTQLAETAARMEAEMVRKADMGDVQRLQHTVRDFRSQNERQTRKLLIGTKCLACDRDLPMDQVGNDVAIDNAKLYQQEELWREVQKVLAEKQTSNPGLGQDVLKFVAVKVGSPRRQAAGGLGPFDVRDDGEGNNYEGTHQLVSSSSASRPSTRTAKDLGDLPARSPPREVPPLVRVLPRRPPGFQDGPSGCGSARAATAPASQKGGFKGFKRNPPPSHSSMKSALGPSAPATARPNTGLSPPPQAPEVPQLLQGALEQRRDRHSVEPGGTPSASSVAFDTEEDSWMEQHARRPASRPSVATDRLPGLGGGF